MKTKSQIDREKHSALDEYFMMITTATLIRSNENLMWHWKLLIAHWALDVSGLLYEAFIVHQRSNVKVWGDLSGLFVSALVDYRKCFSELCSSLFYRDHICIVGRGWKKQQQQEHDRKDKHLTLTRKLPMRIIVNYWCEWAVCPLLVWKAAVTDQQRPAFRQGGWGLPCQWVVGASAIVAVSVGCY